MRPNSAELLLLLLLLLLLCCDCGLWHSCSTPGRDCQRGLGDAGGPGYSVHR